MSRTRFSRYLGLADPRREVDAHLRPLMSVLSDWAVRHHPARESFWAINRAQSALNDLARALTGEPLYRSSNPRPPAHPDRSTAE